MRRSPMAVNTEGWLRGFTSGRRWVRPGKAVGLAEGLKFPGGRSRPEQRNGIEVPSSELLEDSAGRFSGRQGRVAWS